MNVQFTMITEIMRKKIRIQISDTPNNTVEIRKDKQNSQKLFKI